MDLDKKSRLYSALAYARAGYYVLPLHSAHAGKCSCGKSKCKSPGKHPRTSHGSHDATTDEVVIDQWWARWPDANVGMTLDGLVVVDVDPRNGGTVPAALVSHATSIAKTGGGGWHYLFRAVSGSIYPGKHGPGVDIKTGGGAYIVVAPSLHASGEPYEWITYSPADAAPADAPICLSEMAIIPKAPRKTYAPAAARISQNPVVTHPQMPGWVKVTKTTYCRTYNDLAERAIEVFKSDPSES